MAKIDFTVTHRFDASPNAVFAEMIDWKAHEDWIPATRVEIDGNGDATSVDSTFTAYTGYGPLTLVDHMRVDTVHWDAASTTGTCVVEKLGPVLEGQAGFTVSAADDGSQVEWFERVDVKYLPSVLAPIVNRLSAGGFKFGMGRLAKKLRAQATPPAAAS